MSDKFRTLMNAVDDDLLEEAMTTQKRKRPLTWIGVAVAACLLLVLGSLMRPGVTMATLSGMGYDMKLPEKAEHIRYEIISIHDREAAQASFVIRDTKYVYQAVKTVEQQKLSDSGEVLSWNVGNVDIQLSSSGASTSVSWYRSEEQTQWYLTADADSLEVLTTASQILRATGLNVAVAPADARNITYNAFLLDGLTVAETTFELDGITYAYRMAATMELGEDFADISGIDSPFAESIEGQVLWCRAKLRFDRGGRGKVVWFDVVPGILYSLSMDDGADEAALLDLATELFVPAQEEI
ncbi:MAG: hypothetical protein IJY40_05750 [Oscillospiraceae bacterium]|nr:hypothetical protein [Oscillospiraceae bacterium]